MLYNIMMWTYCIQFYLLIIDAIQELSPTSAAGPDGLPSSLLVNSATELVPFLLIIFAHSLSSGVVPPSFKRAAITPVFKSGDRSVPSNYRPISLSSVISKVLERIIRKQVSSFIDKKGFLNSTQHGFRSGRSCLSALLNFLMTSCTCLMAVVPWTWCILIFRRHSTK